MNAPYQYLFETPTGLAIVVNYRYDTLLGQVEIVDFAPPEAEQWLPAIAREIEKEMKSGYEGLDEYITQDGAYDGQS